MNKQDMNGVRTAQDLERKYDFSSIGKLNKNYELQKENLTKVENELNNFAIATTKHLEELQNQVDGNITTWFLNGVPTNENSPANEWITENDKINHLGDLYYDQDTGYAYRWAYENNKYDWSKIVDADVVKALAVANAAQDTADKKRQIFIEQPLPPYDVGDLWIKNEELYRCQTTKDSGEIFEENDWIIATKYTDDTVANQVGNNLTILSGTVTEIRNDVDELNTTITNTTELVDEQGNKIGDLEIKQSETSQTVDEISDSVSTISTDVGNNYQEIINKFGEYTSTSDFATLEKSVTQLQTDTYTKTEINTKLTDGSVTKVMTTSGTFDENGMHYEKTNAPTSSTINERGVEVDSTTTGEELLFAGYDEELNQTIVRTENLTVRKYLVIGDHSRIENYGNGGGIFII